MTKLSSAYNRETALGTSYWGKIPMEDPVMKNAGKTQKNLRMLLYDPHVSAVVESRKTGVRSLEYRLISENVPKKVVRFIEDCLHRINTSQLYDDIVDARLYGYTVLETIYELKNGQLYWKDISQRPQEWFGFDNDNELIFIPLGLFDGVKCNPYKATLIQSGATYSNPYGQALLSKVFWTTQFKLDVMKAWVVYSERFGMPYTIASVNEAAKQSEIQEIEGALKSLVLDAVGVFRKNVQLEFKEAHKSDSSKLFNDLIDFCNREISKAILGQTLSSDIGSSGSYAAAKIHMQVRAEIIDSDIKLVTSTMQHLINKLVELNFGLQTPVPKFALYEEYAADVERSQRDYYLNALGVQFTNQYFIRAYGLRPDDFDVNHVSKTGVAIPVNGGNANANKLLDIVGTNRNEKHSGKHEANADDSANESE